MSSEKSRYLTKTRFVNGLACPKWLWLALNAPERLPKEGEACQHRLDEGRRIGEFARQRFPKGVLIEAKIVEETVTRPTLPASERSTSRWSGRSTGSPGRGWRRP